MQIRDNGIKVNEGVCWCCENTTNITNHHCIPKCMNPVKNVEIPLCQKCHDVLHAQDMTLTQRFAYKIQKTLEDGVRKVSALTNLIKLKKDKQEAMTVVDIIKKR